MRVFALYKLSPTIILLFLSLQLLAQQKTVSFEGSVIEQSSNTPLPFSEIVLSDEGGKVFFHAVVYNTDASFRYENIIIASSKVSLEIKSLGYESFTMTVNRDELEGDIDLGQIPLSPKEYLLDEVHVTASSFVQNVHKNTYLINNTWLKDVSVSLDLLRKVPELTVNEITRTVKIKGKENTLVLINGVNLGESVDIRTINFNDVARIEVVEIPPSSTQVEYDGIINIILKDKITNSFSLDVEETLRGNLKSNDGYLGIRFGRDKVRIRLSYDNYYRGIPSNNRETRTDHTTGLVYNTEGRLKRKEWSHDINLSLDYYISEKDFFNLSTKTSLTDNTKKAYKAEFTQLNDVITKHPDFQTRYASNYTVGNYTAFYKHTFNKVSDYITINGNFNFQNSKENTNSYYSSDKDIVNKEKGNKLAFNLKADYHSSISDLFSFNAGVQSYYQNFNSHINGIVEENNFNNFRYNAYVDTYWALNNYKLTLGFKAENNTYDFKELAHKKINKSILSPKLAVQKKINEKHSLLFNYYRSSYYPSGWLLAPYEIQIDDKTINKGNPELKPQVYDYVGVSHIYRSPKLYLNSTLYYWKGTKLITPTYIFDYQLNSIQSMANLGKHSRWAARLSGSIKVFEFIEFDPDITFYYGKHSANGIKRDKYVVNLSGALYIGLPANFSMGALASYNSQSTTIMGYKKPTYGIDYLFLRKYFKSIGLTLFVGYQDLIRSSEREFIFSNHFSMNTYSKAESRGFAFRIIYNFNSGSKTKMKSIPTDFEFDKK